MPQGKHLNPDFTLRIPRIFLDKLAVLAKENSRSVNKEIEQAIIKYIKEYEEDFGEIVPKPEKY